MKSGSSRAPGAKRPIVEALEEQSEHGVCGDVGVTERAQVMDRAEDLLEEDRAELEREEAALLEEAAGEELLRSARLEALGNADRDAESRRAPGRHRQGRRGGGTQTPSGSRAATLCGPRRRRTVLAALDERKPRWRQQAALPAGGIDLALDAAESGPPTAGPAEASAGPRDGGRVPLTLPQRCGKKRAPASTGPAPPAGMPGESWIGLLDRAHVRSLVAE